VIVSVEEWARKTVRKGTPAEFLLASPLRGADLELSAFLHDVHWSAKLTDRISG
jgi:hypothetical protein